MWGVICSCRSFCVRRKTRLQCARLVRRDYLPAIASHLSTAHTLALDKICTVAIMTSDKRGQSPWWGWGPRWWRRRLRRWEKSRKGERGRRPRNFKVRPLCSRFGAVVCVAASSLVVQIFGGWGLNSFVFGWGHIWSFCHSNVVLKRLFA